MHAVRASARTPKLTDKAQEAAAAVRAPFKQPAHVPTQTAEHSVLEPEARLLRRLNWPRWRPPKWWRPRSPQGTRRGERGRGSAAREHHCQCALGLTPHVEGLHGAHRARTHALKPAQAGPALRRAGARGSCAQDAQEGARLTENLV